jgi:hypothetical protein
MPFDGGFFSRWPFLYMVFQRIEQFVLMIGLGDFICRQTADF